MLMLGIIFPGKGALIFASFLPNVFLLHKSCKSTTRKIIRKTGTRASESSEKNELIRDAITEDYQYRYKEIKNHFYSFFEIAFCVFFNHDINKVLGKRD
jgi:hypothetical protein